MCSQKEYKNAARVIPMPRVSPVPMRTIGKPWLTRFVLWLFGTRTWEIIEDYCITFRHPILKRNVRLMVPRTFVCDFASVPKVFWFLLSPIGVLLIGSIFHDFGYRYSGLYVYNWSTSRYHFTEMTKKDLDSMFMHINIWSTDMILPNWVAKVVLTLFGWFAWRNSRKRNSNVFLDFGNIRM